MQKHLFGLNEVSYYTLAGIPNIVSKVTKRIEVSYLENSLLFCLFRDLSSTIPMTQKYYRSDFFVCKLNVNYFPGYKDDI